AQAVDRSLHLGERARRRARIDRHEIAASVLKGEQAVGKREQSNRLTAHLILAIEQIDLVLVVVVEQDVVDTSLLRQLLEIQLGKSRAPSGIELAHPLALRR